MLHIVPSIEHHLTAIVTPDRFRKPSDDSNETGTDGPGEVSLGILKLTCMTPLTKPGAVPRYDIVANSNPMVAPKIPFGVCAA